MTRQPRSKISTRSRRRMILTSHQLQIYVVATSAPPPPPHRAILWPAQNILHMHKQIYVTRPVRLGGDHICITTRCSVRTPPWEWLDLNMLKAGKYPVILCWVGLGGVAESLFSRFEPRLGAARHNIICPPSTTLVPFCALCAYRDAWTHVFE